MLVFSLLGQAVQAAPTVTDIEFASRPGSKIEVRLDFDETPPPMEAYTIEKPARIAIDFPGTRSALPQKSYSLPYGNATGVVVLESGDRTRLVLNLVKLVPYETRVEGNSLFLVVGQGSSGDYVKPSSDPNALTARVEQVARERSSINDLQFQRAGSGEARLTLELSNPSVDVNVFSERGDIRVQFLDTSVPEHLMRRFDVTDFATPVTSVDVNSAERGATLTLKTVGEFDYLAYQTDNQYVIAVKPLTKKELEERRDEFTYVGERISLNFQDIEVRAVLQLIADFTELNLVASDTVSGRITLRLQNVPWDQALELVLRTKGLDKRQVGNVLMVAPAAEIAERERQQIEANKQIAELAPLQSEFIRIRYASAASVVSLFEAGSEDGGTLISPRGSVIVEPRTNSLIVTETASKLAEIRDLIDLVDIPIRQVMIEARIVIAQSDLEQELGIEWGGGFVDSDVNGNALSVSGDTANVAAINQSVIDGTASGVNFPGALMVDLGVASKAGGFAVGFTSEDLFLTAELSALEAAGNGEVVSQPKVITGDKQKAIIKSGSEIPYQEGSLSGQNTTSFKEAVLQLDVTPNITPDDRILLDLVITQDSLGDLVPSGQGGFIPSIDTTELTTQVLVGNGETVVLGGVFRTEDIESVTKVPFFGDIPYVGRLFRNESNSKTKTETLIFITPRILADSLLD
ncbi:MAG: type IV pilus secretin PilQ [Haliea sp.]|jgi:type IV pilus assembly protein PilQ|uniref:type IV pilus secretin PilQ n=1 Tax=Haliea sp. TaxID=1932666 RepID=UPI000C52B857|nr:type IV pilus secretin PilQ [Haliea sp.]MBM69197.1 type IV pilus secretin PilQ [Haliea sp.]|tara:strand:- start:578 stop:2650 length:2073 start_codon:yes stop_codon:yes gene_type:complete